MFQTSEWTKYLSYTLLGLVGVGLLIGLYFLLRKRFGNRRKEKEIKRMISGFELRREVRLFMSYSHADSALFHIPKIAKNLEKYEKIVQVLYSQKDSRDDFVKYMNKYLEESDAILLFCTETSAESEFVIDEWAAARALKKPIIPVFIKEKFIPALFRAKIGAKFDPNKFPDSLKEIYGIIKRRLGDPIEID